MHSSEADQVPAAAPQGSGRKKGTACVRCRTQKVRCDDQQPACANCARVGHTCLRLGLGIDPSTLSHLGQVETRLRWLEDVLQQVAPERLEYAPNVSAAQQPPTEPQPTSDSPATGQGWAQVKPVGQRSDGTSITSPHNEQEAPNQPPSNAGGNSDTCTDVSPASTVSAQIKPNESLAHEVGLLSLTNATESKYLGPSSGVPFARLIFSTIPQSQGLATCLATSIHGPTGPGSSGAEALPRDWIFQEDLQHFLDAYFETYAFLYPFLDEETTRGLLHSLGSNQSDGLPYGSRRPRLSDMIDNLSHPMLIQLLLVVALGSRILESQLSTEFASERYLATGLAYLGSLILHDSIEGLQIMLLLTLCSMDFMNGPNGWFLTANIIASCLDLGFQRKWIEITAPMTSQQRQQVELRKTLRSGIFWSAYSLERQMAVVLGRPLTLRDEAIDVEFPGSSTIVGDSRAEESTPSTKRAKVEVCSPPISHFSFRFDQLLAEIKLTLHRVVNKPSRFPWPTDTATFQSSMHQHCDDLYREVMESVKRLSHRSTPNHTVRTLEVKYHHCLLLLHRPSPAIPLPSLDSWRICYHSAVRTINVLAELQRFCKLNNSWLTAHTAFVCGISFLYCLWVNPTLLREISVTAFTSNTEKCSSLLKHLGKTWSVASDALDQFDRLVQATMALWSREEQQGNVPAAGGSSMVPMHESMWPEARSTNYAEASNMGPSSNLHSQGFMFDNESLGLESFHTELGSMTNWFDLDWIGQSQSFGA